MSPSDRSPTRVRADQRLVAAGLTETRQHARALILAGLVFLEERRIEKAGQLVASDAKLRLSEQPRYVGRGGDKLEGALNAFSLDVGGLVALDIGASTGGFTDCLLQHGAVRVYAVDAGRGQLADRLRRDPRVSAMERTNARYPYTLPEAVDLVTADVSFISLRLVLPEALRRLNPGGHVLALVKPQFEAGRDRVGRRGVITDPKVHASVVGAFCTWATGQTGLRLYGIRKAALTGNDGNQEFFVLLRLPD